MESEADEPVKVDTMTSTNEHWTDEDCQGWCPCPLCGGPATWSYVHHVHTCVDRACATIFQSHARPEIVKENDTLPQAGKKP